MTHTQYVNRLRIDEAQALLRTSEQTITDIALAVGFTNHTHFYRVFQQLVGCSPSVYRTQIDESAVLMAQPSPDGLCLLTDEPMR